MLPLGPRYAVARADGGYYSPAGVLVPVPDTGHSHVGIVLAKGLMGMRAGLPLELAPGARVLYSSRVDSFDVDGVNTPVDIVEEKSVIAVI